MNKKRRVVQVLIGITILTLLFYEIDFHEVLRAIKEVNILLFVLAAASYLCYHFFMAYRLSYLLSKMANKIRFSHSFFAHIAGMLTADVTPGSAGFFLVPYFLKNRTNCSISKGMAAIIAPQGIEFILKVVGGSIGVIFFITVISLDISVSLLVPFCIGGCIFFALGVAILWIVWSGESYSANLLAKIPLIRKFKHQFDEMKENSFHLKGSIFVIIGIYFICWTLLAVQWQLLGLALGVTELSFLAYFLLHPLITILRFVPITVSGLGLMEGATAIMFLLLGIPNGVTLGLSFSLLVRLNMILVDSIGLNGVFSKPALD
ncbi:MAG: lysylphosphatidylglycerol synthase transmembrane domain-containing protein [archaeon]|nr:lysylphosphatidylglycerol synthase transmembrane domain-containing protein [archaeon]